MAKFVYVYIGGQMAETPEAQEQAMQAWGAWFGTLGDSVADMGNPFGNSATVSSGQVGRGRLLDRVGRLAERGDGEGKRLPGASQRRVRRDLRGHPDVVALAGRRAGPSRWGGAFPAARLDRPPSQL